MRFSWLGFDEIGARTWYRILALRQQVFILEQECFYLDCDGWDQPAEHLLAHDACGELAGYMRLLPPGVAYSECSFGRLVTPEARRGERIGALLMHLCLLRARRLYGDFGMRISAQLYLRDTYARRGFTPTGDPYMDAGILHIQMTHPLKSPALHERPAKGDPS